MRTRILSRILLIAIFITAMYSFTTTKNIPSKIKETMISYTLDGVTYKGYIVYDQNKKGKRPAILVVHEWWGMNDYVKMRAKQLASLGYIAMAVDMYGSGKVAANPAEAKEMTAPFYKDPQLGKKRLDAAIQKIKESELCDTTKIAAIGYCFGGSIVLNSAKLGARFKGVVSFHGGLAGVPANKDLLKASILVCHGGSDKFIPQTEIENFKKQLDEIGADYTFKIYPNSTHAFTNPESTRVGKAFNMPIEYNAEADKNSWNDMKVFLNTVFKK